jgi:hypothetical protein
MTNAAWVSLGILAVIIAACVPFAGGRDFLKSWAKGVIAFTVIATLLAGATSILRQCSRSSLHPNTELWNRR